MPVMNGADYEVREFAVPDTYRIPAMIARIPKIAKTTASARLPGESPDMYPACTCIPYRAQRRAQAAGVA